MMGRAAKGSRSKAHRQPGNVSKSIPKRTNAGNNGNIANAGTGGSAMLSGTAGVHGNAMLSGTA